MLGKLNLKNKFVFLGLVLASFGLASLSILKAEAQAPAHKELKKQTLSFEDELVEGSAQKPELFYLLQKKNFNYKRLIRLRENFLPEMRESSEVIHRSGSGN